MLGKQQSSEERITWGCFSRSGFSFNSGEKEPSASNGLE
jgi:hypothetical protein